jgi:hypothetical protein
MATKRTTNKLYWAVVATYQSGDLPDYRIACNAYAMALDGHSDAELQRRFTISSLFSRHDVRGGLHDLNRASRNRWSRQNADAIRINHDCCTLN